MATETDTDTAAQPDTTAEAISTTEAEVDALVDDLQSDADDVEIPVETVDDDHVEGDQVSEPSGDDTVSSEIDGALLDRAAALGMLPSEMRGMDPDTLDVMLGHFEHAAEEAKAAATTHESTEFKVPEFDVDKALGQDADLVDDEVKTLSKAMNEHIKGVAKSLMESVDKRFSSIEDAGRVARFDGLVRGLGEDYEKSLGKGDSSSLSPGSKAARNRKGIQEQMKVISSGRKANGLRALSETVLFEAAVGIALNGEVTAIARNSIKSKVERRGRTAISRPKSKSQAGSESDLATARRNMARRLEGLGYDPNEEDKSIDELLID